MFIVTGIGSRETPSDILVEMTKFGQWCLQEGVFLRSGHADGADFAFESGAQQQCIAYLPWVGFNKQLVSGAYLRVPVFTKALYDLAKKYHPAWDRLSDGAKKLQARNGCQMFGENLDKPTNVVVAYTIDGTAKGGTGQALRIAADNNIPIINMFHFPKAKEVIFKVEEILKFIV